MVAAKNNAKRKNGASGQKRFNKQINGNPQRRLQQPSFNANQFLNNPIPNPGYVDFNEPVINIPPVINNAGRPTNAAMKKQPPPNTRSAKTKRGFNGNAKMGPGPMRNFPGPRRPMPPAAFLPPPPPHVGLGMPRPFPGAGFRRPLFGPPPPPGLMRRPIPPPFMGPMMGPAPPMMVPPIPPRRRPGIVSKVINKKNKPTSNRKKGPQNHSPTYPLDKPWVSNEIKEMHAKKTDLENRLKGHRDDALFAEYKKQRDLFVKMYDEAKLNHMCKNNANKQEANLKVTDSEKPIENGETAVK